MSANWKSTIGAAKSPNNAKVCTMIFANVHTFPTEITEEFKKDSMRDMLYSSNLFAFSEHNLNHISYNHTTRILPSQYGRSTIKYSHLPYATDDPNCPGGAGLILDSKLTKSSGTGGCHGPR